MSRIATITFHWVNNYGAVLQAYALQRYLLQNGFDTEIIHYVPKNVTVQMFLNDILHLNMKSLVCNFKKSHAFQSFVNQELLLTKRKYPNCASLFALSDRYPAIICGSDQIWNEWFLFNAEKKAAPSYYLNFAGEHTLRIAYAVSFGADRLQEKTRRQILPQLQKFQSLSVRERSGVEILRELGFQAALVIDPTLLLDWTQYAGLANKYANRAKTQPVFVYILHSDQPEAIKTRDHVLKYYKQKTSRADTAPAYGVYEWLRRIDSAELVVTNSFHGVAMSILAHKQFIAVTVQHSDMNNRLYTLLSYFGLEHRIIQRYDPAQIDGLLCERISYSGIDQCLDELRAASAAFLFDALRQVQV